MTDEFSEWINSSEGHSTRLERLMNSGLTVDALMDAFEAGQKTAANVDALYDAMQHAFLSGFIAAKNLPAHNPYCGMDHWGDYDHQLCAEHRILSALEV